MSEHSREPWHIVLGFAFHALLDADENILLTSNYGFWKEVPRVLACVNACMGVSTTSLIQASRAESLVVLGKSDALVRAVREGKDQRIVAYRDGVEHLKAMSHGELVDFALNEQLSTVFWQKRCEEMESRHE